MHYEGNPTLGALMGLMFLSMGVWMLVYDLISMFRNKGDWTQTIGVKWVWGESGQSDDDQRLVSMPIKLFIVYPFWTLISGVAVFTSITEMKNRGLLLWFSP